MSSSSDSPELSKARRASLHAVYLVLLTGFFFVAAEVVLRVKGARPWRKVESSIRIEPGGKLYVKHPTLGYSHIPGEFLVALDSDYSFRLTHLPNTLRITHSTGELAGSENKEEIWIFGCSYTHGWSVDDEQTFPWLVQKRFPEYEVVNFGVGGYGTVQSLLQFQDALAEGAPKVAVLAYASFHDERNTFSRTRRKYIVPWNSLGPLTQPYARLTIAGELRLLSAGAEYTEFPMMRHSALVHFIERKYNRIELESHRSHLVSQALVLEMSRLASEHGVRFIVAGIGGSHAMLEFAEEEGIPNVDISIDRNLPENTNDPHDDHPSAIAHQRYADALERFLKAELLDHG